MTPRRRIDLDGIKRHLADDAEALALHLFGEPNLRRGQKWTWGRKGSLVVNIAGRWRGRFRSWEADAGGSMLDAIMFARGCDFDEALRWAKEWLGDDTRPLPARPVVRDIDAEELKRRDKARAIHDAARPISGTPAERYLRGRGIKPDIWPESVRWDDAIRAVVFGSTAPDGTISAIQRVFLNADGSPRLDGEGRKIKRSLGPRYGGAVRFDGDERALCIAEGPETALSVWHATGIATWAALGAVGSVDLAPVPVARTILVCRDDDAKNAPSRKALRDAIKQWRREGRTVLEALPHQRSRRDKSDFNDALCERGPEAVAERIEAVLAEAPTTQREAMPLAWARKSLADATRKAVAELWNGRDEDEPPALALKVSLGLGKTEQALAEALRWIEAGRGPVVYAVPTHALSDELQERAEAMAKGRIRVAVWRGREADDPEAEGERMCRDLDAVKAVQRIGGNPQKLVCMDGDKRCPFADVCGYQRQRQQQAELWLVAHHALFSRKPEPIPSPSLVVIDEAFWQAGLRGIAGRPVVVTPHQIELQAYAKDDADTADLDADLMPQRRKLAAALAAHDDGPLARAALIDAGLTQSDAVAAAKAEWRRMVDVAVWPGMNAEQRREALVAASVNAEVPRMARMWRCIADLLADGGPALSGSLSVAELDDDGAKYRGIRLRWREGIAGGWQAPTMHIDATLDLELVRPYLPRIELRADIEAETPHQRVVQYADRAFSKSALRNERTLDKVWRWTVARARAAGGRWLVVAQKDAEAAIRARHAVPDFIDIAHHNAVAGRDEWKDVRGLVVVGRTMPPPAGVEAIAAALTGRHVTATESPDGWYSATTATLRDRAGNALTVEAERADDPTAEAVRRGVCEGELAQIIGRARGVNRTADDPVEIVVLGNVPLGEVDELAEWSPASKDAEIFAELGILLSSEGDMATAAGMKADSLRKARQRSGTFPYKGIYYGNVPHLRTATYRRAGAGRKPQRIVYDPRSIADIRAFLADRLGPLADFAEDSPQKPPADPPAMPARQAAPARELDIILSNLIVEFIHGNSGLPAVPIPIIAFKQPKGTAYANHLA